MITEEIYGKENTLWGDSSDSKPLNAHNGQLFVEVDTGKEYRFDSHSSSWVEQ